AARSRLSQLAATAGDDRPRKTAPGELTVSRQDMVEIPAGSFRMGSANFYPEEAPAREVQIHAFAIDRGPVTVAQFARFIADAGYLTVAERPLDAVQYPDADPSLLVEGSAVFRPTPGPVA